MIIAKDLQEKTAPLWQWQASLALLLCNSKRGTILKQCRHHGPLYLQKPFYPEGKHCAHLYLLHPPGGLVSGDTLTISVHLTDGAQALITTPGAARVYHARQQHPTQQQIVTLNLDKGAAVEWFPMETIIYNGAHAALTTTIELDDNSHFIGWEITCLGLPASGKQFTQGQFTQHLRINRHGMPLLIERFCYNAENPLIFNAAVAMQKRSATGIFIAGPFSHQTTSDEIQACLNMLRTTINTAKLDHVIAITWVNHFCIARYLGDSANQARDAFTLLWEILRPQLLKRKACAPRIWLT